MSSNGQPCGADPPQPFVCVYVDNSNIFIEAQRLAKQRNGGPNVQFRVRIDYDKLLQLCHANRTLKAATAAGSIPPALRHLWARLRNIGLNVRLFKRKNGGERDVPDILLQKDMYHDLAKIKPPGVAVLVTGDGASTEDNDGFIPLLQDMADDGWGVEVLSWQHCLNRKLLEWAQQHGVFVPLDNYYDAITYLEPEKDGDGLPRDSAPLDLTNRLTSYPRVNNGT